MITINIKGHSILAKCWAESCIEEATMIIKMDSGITTDCIEDSNDWVFYCTQHGIMASNHNMVKLK